MRTTVKLKGQENGQEYEAKLFDEVTSDHFLKSQDLWRPVLYAAAKALKAQGKSIPRYLHWDWRQKASALGRLDASFYGIECGGRIQGLMKTDLGPLRRCRLDSQKGKELVYVDYVETAPWNNSEYMEVLGFKAIYSRTGTRLMQAAVQLSVDNEFKGRVGLHSLPETEDFYRAIGMTPVERDPNKQDLLWFEFTPDTAQSFLEKTV